MVRNEIRCTTIAKIHVLIILAVTAGKVYAAASITLLTEDTPPVNYLGDNQQPAGLAVELVNEMVKRVGDPGRIKVVPWAQGYRDDSKEQLLKKTGFINLQSVIPEPIIAKGAGRFCGQR